MWTLPVASFLAGSLLSLILPVGLLIAIVIWYVVSIRRTPERPDSADVRAIAASAETPAADPSSASGTSSDD
jgi:hypothetical protein